MNFRITNILPTAERSVKIEFRLFEITLFLTVTFFLFWSVFGFIVGYGFFIQTVYLSGLFIYSGIYYLQKREISFRALSLTYYYLVLFLLAISWLPSGGIKGAIPTFLAMVYLSGLLVLPLKDYLIFIIITFGIVLGLIVYEINYPDQAAPYLDYDLLIQDLAIATLVSLIIMGVCLFLFKRTYVEDRKELRKKNSELEKKKVSAESTDQAKTTFLATISHEMRTPLNGIVGITELLSKTKTNTEQEELIESLMYSSDILHGLVKDVLDITTIEAGKMKLQVGSFAVRDELKTLWNVFEKKISSNPNLEIKINFDQSLPEHLSGDLARIRQVLVNLLNNALKFTYKGSIVLDVKVAGLVGNVASIQFLVTDTGVGIPEDKQPYLFDTFYKGSEATGYEGTGLGLSIVEKLVKLMGGKVYFESIPQQGSKFHFTLPLGVVEKGDVSDFKQIVIPGLKELKVLIVEDVEINRLVAKKLLKSLGIETIAVAINGTQGVEEAKEKFYDIIFMDLQMPDISGFEASLQISKHFEDKEKKPIIIALTANAMKSSMEECYASGMSDYILKPIKSDIIKEVLMKYLNPKTES
ncbi:ATP-binding protein [Ekhidna sp.]